MDHESVKKNSIQSIVSLFLQSGYSAILGFVANIALTIFLEPAVFGIYITVLSLISLLNYFSDIGLAASLIQRKEVSDNDLTTAFTIQQMLIVTVITIAFLATSVVMNFYDVGQDGKVLYWSLLIAFFISSLKTIPSVKLEREIKYRKIVLVQVLENTVFYVTVVILSALGFGLLSFAYSVVARAIIGLIAIYAISPWMPRFYISRESARHLLSFGVPFQTISFLALIKDEFVNLFLGKFIGFEALGYIGWAKKWAEAPLRIIMDNVSKIIFPLFARFQHDKDQQHKLIEFLLKYQTLIIFPASLGIALVMPALVMIIPKYHKWVQALPMLYIFTASAFISSYSTPLINFFNGIGKVKISFYFMIFWTVMTWVLIVPLTHAFGSLGFPITVLLLSMSSFSVMYIAKKHVDFYFWKTVRPYIGSGLLMFVVLVVIRENIAVDSYADIALLVIIGGMTYITALASLFKVHIINDIKVLLKKA